MEKFVAYSLLLGLFIVYVICTANANNSEGRCKYNSVREVPNFHLDNLNNNTHSSLKWSRCDGYKERGVTSTFMDQVSLIAGNTKNKTKPCHIFKPQCDILF